MLHIRPGGQAAAGESAGRKRTRAGEGTEKVGHPRDPPPPRAPPHSQDYHRAHRASRAPSLAQSRVCHVGRPAPVPALPRPHCGLGLRTRDVATPAAAGGGAGSVPLFASLPDPPYAPYGACFPPPPSTTPCSPSMPPPTAFASAPLASALFRTSGSRSSE